MSFMPLRRLFVLMMVSSLLVLGLLLALQPPNVAAEEDGTAALSTDVSGVIAANTTWTLAASPYVITDNLTIASGVKLTIQPGVQIRIGDNRRITVSGELSAQATALNPITFTAQSGTWHSLYFAPGSVATLERVWVGNGGVLSADGMVVIASNAVTIRNSVFRDGGQDYNDALVYVSEASPRIEGNLFANSSAIGLRFEGYDDSQPLVVRNNQFQNNPDVAMHITMREEARGILFEGNSSSGSGHNGVRIGDGGFNRAPYLGIITGTVTITGQENFPILVEAPYIVTVPEGAKLILTAGTVVKLQDERIDIRGGLVTNGTPAKPVVFTSVRDDSVVGDSNGDGNASQPSAGNWRSIYFGPTAKGNELHYTQIRYGGYSTAEGMVIVESSDLLMDHVSLTHGTAADESDQDAALRIERASPTIRNSRFDDNTYWAIQWNGFDKSKPVVFENNSFNDNGTGAVWAMLDRERVNVTLIGNSSSGSKFNGFMLTDMSSLAPGITGTVTISGQPNFPFIVGGAVIGTGVLTRNLTVGPQAHLTLPAGTLIKQSTCIAVQGRLTAVGEAARPIIFTSIHDDSVGGDTNGNGAAVVPADGRSGGLRFASGSQGTLRYVQSRYGGTCGEAEVLPTARSVDGMQATGIAANLVVESSGVAISQSKFSQAGPPSVGAGIVISGVSIGVTATEVYSNGGNGIVVYGAGAQPSIEDNQIYGNGASGIYLMGVHSNVPMVRNTIANNVGHGLHGEGDSFAILRSNVIVGNGMGATQVSSQHVEIDARGNFWGSASGPHHAAKNPAGAGNGVSDDVNFALWLAGLPSNNIYVPTVQR